MGSVWLATDTLLDRPVALKYLKITQESVYKEFFLSEARALASLNHPNITQIYDAVFDEKDDSFYLVMEYVEGTPLSKLIANWAGPMSLEFAVEVAIGVLQALGYAHEKDLVHRDVKPDNVLISNNSVKLMDFGVAGLISLLAKGSDYIVGTPAYISPEQIEGIPLDGRADLYSLGVMLYEMATGGTYPFEGANASDFYDAHLLDPPLALREFVPDIPLAFERVVMRLLAKAPDERFPSAQAVLDIFRTMQARQKFSQPYLLLPEAEAKPLVGRTEALEQLKTIWTDCREHADPGLVVVQGEAGAGKSRLITEFLGREVIDQGFVALVGRGGESGVPYAPFAEIFAAIINKNLTGKPLSQSQVDQLLNHIPSLARLINLPEGEAATAPEAADPAMSGSGLWQTLNDKLTESVAANPWQSQWQFFATILTILTDLGPTVLFLENGTSLDEASVTAARFLVEQQQLPLLVATACREKSGPPAWYDSFPDEKKVLISLPPLPTEEITELVTELVGGPVSDEAIRVIEGRSHGNPLQIEEFTHQLVASGQLQPGEKNVWHYTPAHVLVEPDDILLPKAVFNVFSRRVEQLAEASREALAVAALAEPGSEFDFELWVALLGGEGQREKARQVVEEGIKARLLRRIGDEQYAFRPADVARALLSLLPEPRRRDLHRRAAEILQQRQADPILVGYHYQQAGSVAEAARHLETAGARAMAANAVSTAIAYYDRAASLAESGPARLALGELFRENGELAKSIEAYEQALALKETANDVELQARILNGLSFTLWLSDRYKTAYQRAAAVLKLEAVSSSERAMAHSNLGMVSWLAGRLAEAEKWCLKAFNAVKDLDNQVSLSTTAYRLGLIYFSQTRLAEAETVFQQALTLRQPLGWSWGQAHCRHALGQIAVERGDFESAAAYFEAAQQLFEAVNSQGGLMVLYTSRGRMLLYQGRPAEALAWLTKALPLALKGKRNAYYLSQIYRLLAQLSLKQNQLKRARAAAMDALKLVEAAGNQEHVAAAQATLAQIYAAQGDAPAAKAMYGQALTLFDRVGHRAGRLRTQVSYAQFLNEQGQAERAAELEQAARAEAETVGLFLDEKMV